MFSAILAAHLFTEAPLHEVEKIPTGHQRLILVRHGESLLNASGMKYVSGKSPLIPLTSKGVEQARTLAEKLEGKMDREGSFLICSSTALRAHETALHLFAILSKQFDCQMGEAYEGLSELGHGDWEGQPKDDAYALAMKNWEDLSAKEKFTSPKLNSSESHAAVAERAFKDLQAILDAHPCKTIFAVSHFMAMNALALHWSGAVPELSEVPGSKLPQMVFDNCDLLIVDVPEGQPIEKGRPLLHVKAHI